MHNNTVLKKGAVRVKQQNDKIALGAPIDIVESGALVMRTCKFTTATKKRGRQTENTRSAQRNLT